MSEARKARHSEEVGVGGVSPVKGVSREDRAGFTGTRAPGSELGEPSGGRGECGPGAGSRSSRA